MMEPQCQESEAERLYFAFAEQLRQALAQAFAPQLAELTRQLTEPVRDMAAQAFAPVTEQLNRLSSQLAQWIKPLSEAVRRMLELAELDAQKVGPVFPKAGFWLTPSTPMNVLIECKRLDAEGKLMPDAVKQIFLETYRENHCAALVEMVHRWQQNPLFAQRMHIFQDALNAHLAGKYTLSVPALLPQAEGIASRIIGSPPGRSQKIIRT